MKKILFPFAFILILCSCLPDEPTFEDFRRAEVRRMLSNEDIKRWSLDERILFGNEVSFDSCENPRQLIFEFTSSNKDKDSLFYINPADTCGNSTDTLKGFWFVPPTLTAESPIDTVVFIWESIDTAYFEIENIDPESFRINTYFEEDSLTESFIHFPLPADSEEDGE